MTLPRRTLLFAPLLAAPLLSGCADDAAPSSYPPPSYDYLTKLELKIGRIEVDDSWAPRGAARHVENLAPITPREALRRMAEDRLVAAGNSGWAVFVIEDASIIRGPRDYEASFAVRLDMADDNGNRLGQATARVVQVRPVRDDSPRAVRDDLYAFVRDVMREMNVEFEFQVRRALRDALQSTSPTAPEPGPVDAQPLDGRSPDGQAAPAITPESTPASPPAPGGPPATMSPPPGPLTAPPGASAPAGSRPPTSLVPPAPLSR